MSFGGDFLKRFLEQKHENEPRYAFAMRAGIPVQTLDQWEMKLAAGRGFKPHRATIQKIIDGLGGDMNWWISGQGTPPPKTKYSRCARCKHKP